MPTIKIKENFAEVAEWLDRKALKQMHFASVVALNRTGKIIKEGVLQVMKSRFDRATPYTMNSLYVNQARKAQAVPEARIFFKDDTYKGTPAAKYLSPNVYGSARRHKRFEKAMIHKGMMPANKFITPASGAQLDQYGNVKRSQITKVMSAIQAFGEQGYQANRTGSKRSMKKARKNDYFIGDPVGLGNGIWQRVGAGSGTMGGGVKPVFMFVDAPRYKVIVPFEKIAENMAEKHLPEQFAKAFDEAMQSAK